MVRFAEWPRTAACNFAALFRSVRKNEEKNEHRLGICIRGRDGQRFLQAKPLVICFVWLA